ncbi:unnamed protein product [Blepharisma stoltei]|uniref:AN1-type domain-containing protein n=1 Tax=Blepharisma stoltei TaxID=1481888 RepID=A0AAU9ILJ6_9CILI|nr:unnamed protein product [Blepharisma stoltei]
MESQMCRCCKKFYGNQNGMCSMCFKMESLKTEANKALPELISSTQAIPEENKAEEPEPLCESDRCWTCKKRVGPLIFKCKCNYPFCAKHRVPEAHGCTFDHRSHGIRKLSEDNPQVVAEKFNKLL